MLGEGLYFSNCSTKSFNYCFPNLYNNIGCLLLCKVSLGKILKITQLSQYYNKELQDYQSIKGLGLYTPHVDKNNCKINNTYAPIGKLQIRDNTLLPYLKYDEYICYNEDRVQIDYVIFCKID